TLRFVRISVNRGIVALLRSERAQLVRSISRGSRKNDHRPGSTKTNQTPP
ncbi:hypothetical protein BaRGS_00025005, partial [Batillaria attramentaria]